MIGREMRIVLRMCVALLAFAPATARALPPVSLELVGTFQAPVYVTHAGDERLFVSERAGRILVHDPVAGTLVTPFLDLTGVVDTSGDGGLFTGGCHRDYALNGLFYVAYTVAGSGGAALRSVVARYQVSAGDPNLADADSGVVLIELDALDGAAHTAAQLAFGPDGALYAGFGDGGGHGGPGCRAQQVDDTLGAEAFFGKILRLDVDQNVDQAPYHGIPADNPFGSPSDGVADEIWALGLRNPWRFSFDRATGDLWIADVGESTREEIDRQVAASAGGENYGWKVMEGSFCHDPDPVDPACPAGTASCFDPGYTAPLFEYPNTGWATDACSIIGGYVYRGPIASLRGAYIFGDFCGGFVWALEETSPGAWSRSELADLGMGLTSFGEDLDGDVYVTHGNSVYRISGPLVPALGGAGKSILALVLLGSGLLVGPRIRRWHPSSRSAGCRKILR